MKYSIAILIQSVYWICELRYLATFLGLALHAFIFAFTVSKDLVNELHSTNKKINEKTSESNIMKQFIVFIDLHCDVKQLS